MNRLSVIIPAYKQTALTVVHVRECMNSYRVPDEIIVVNDHGDETLFDELQKLEKKTKIIYAYILQDVGFGYNHACNLGFWLSRGDFITLEDADHIPLREAYSNATEILEDRPEIDRVSFSRYWVPLENVLTLPYKDWVPTGVIGPNSMVAMYRREVYAYTKGQDERMNEYGWLAYDWKVRETKVGVKTMKAGQFYIVKDGSEQNIKRGMSKKNRKFYKENTANPHPHGENGVLNFMFHVKQL